MMMMCGQDSMGLADGAAGVGDGDGLVEVMYLLELSE